MGTVGTVVYGIVMLDESASVVQLMCIAMIVGCIIGLKVSNG